MCGDVCDESDGAYGESGGYSTYYNGVVTAAFSGGEKVVGFSE